MATRLCDGSYLVQVEDSIGCVVIGSATITEPSQIISSISGVNLSCFNSCDGIAQTAPTGGVPGYTHIWTPGGSTDDTVIALCAGTYIDTITDATGCYIVDTIILTEPTLLTVTITDSTNISCNGICDGDATVTAGGGDNTI